MNARMKMLASARRASAAPVEININPYPYKHRSAFTRLAQWFTPDRVDRIIGWIGVIGTLGAFGWTAINWLVLGGWL